MNDTETPLYFGRFPYEIDGKRVNFNSEEEANAFASLVGATKVEKIQLGSLPLVIG